MSSESTAAIECGPTFLDSISAVALLQKALATDPLAPVPLTDLATTYLWRGQPGDYEQALSLWTKVPRDVFPYFCGGHYAWTLLATQHLEEAEKVLQGFLEEPFRARP